MGAYHRCLPEFCRECDRFGAWYRVSGNEEEARARASDICLEQVVEFGAGSTHDGFVRNPVSGRIDRIDPVPDAAPEAWLALITYPNTDSGFDLTQLLNTLYGTLSLKRGFRLERLKDCPGLWRHFRGPRFGREGMREQVGAGRRPLLCVSLKARGRDSAELAALAGELAASGADLVKDDHQMPNTDFGTFAERVARCSEAVQAGAARAQRKVLYAPNVTAPAAQLHDRARYAKAQGAGALLVCPGLVGFDAMRTLADDDQLGLPILAHPALLGSHLTSADNGIAHYVLLGQLMRLAGADATLFPHAGGRYGFSLDECVDVALGSSVPLGECRPIFPAAAGVTALDQVPPLLDLYGADLMILVGADVLQQGSGVAATCAQFASLLETAGLAWTESPRPSSAP